MTKNAGPKARAAIDAAGGLWTSREIAERWGISEQAISRRIDRGNFPEPVKIAGRVRLYLLADVEPYRAGKGPGGQASQP